MLEDYRHSGYDRGHQAPAGDENRSVELKDETFYLSNMAPQEGPFNQRIWAALEEKCRQWAREHREAVIVTGGMFYDPEEEKQGQADGLIEFWTVGQGQVHVPTHFYKIVAAPDQNGQWQAIAFVLENKAYKEPYQFARYVKSVDWVEERTGLDFMPDLDAGDEARMERNPSAMW